MLAIGANIFGLFYNLNPIVTCSPKTDPVVKLV